ncbi:ATP-binding protein, partial [Streptomyces albidoflavus]
MPSVCGGAIVAVVTPPAPLAPA